MNFSQAIGVSLKETVNKLAERTALDGKDLYGPTRAALEPVRSEFKDQLDRFSIGAYIPDLFE
jgi:hypothetical protein